MLPILQVIKTRNGSRKLSDNLNLKGLEKQFTLSGVVQPAVVGLMPRAGRPLTNA
jgi:hypothetical protein